MEDTPKHGVKRKRETQTESEDTAARLLRAKLHHGLRETIRATKKVKAFGTQRVVKKLKAARKGGGETDIESLEEQLECLKHIDLNDIAAKALRSKIKKDALLSKNEDCQEAVSSELPLSLNASGSSSTVQTLVQSRMLSSKILSSEAVNVIQTLKRVLGVGMEDTPVTGDDSKASSIDRNGGDQVVTALKTPQSRGRSAVANDNSGAGEDEEDEEESEEAASWTGFDRIDSSGESGQSDDDADDAIDPESGDDDEDEEQSLVSDNPHSHSASSHDNSSIPPSAKKTRPSNGRHSTPKQKIGKAGESAFLPSLSVGFISGSDSEWSESEMKVADLPIKKNRRGQRARKAIWEKKYGRNANHLKKLREGKDDVRGGDTATARTGRGQRGRFEGRGRGIGRGRGRGRASGVSGSRTAMGTGTGTGAPPTSRGRNTNSVVRGHSRDRGHTHNEPPPPLTTHSSPSHHHRHTSNRPNHTNKNKNNKNNKTPNQQGTNNINSKSTSSTSNVPPSYSKRRSRGDDDDDNDAARTDKNKSRLHPSWEAKRKLKEKESEKLAIVPSTGTRIKFT